MIYSPSFTRKKTKNASKKRVYMFKVVCFMSNLCIAQRTQQIGKFKLKENNNKPISVKCVNCFDCLLGILRLCMHDIGFIVALYFA